MQSLKQTSMKYSTFAPSCAANVVAEINLQEFKEENCSSMFLELL